MLSIIYSFKYSFWFWIRNKICQKLNCICLHKSFCFSKNVKWNFTVIYFSLFRTTYIIFWISVKASVSTLINLIFVKVFKSPFQDFILHNIDIKYVRGSWTSFYGLTFGMWRCPFPMKLITNWTTIALYFSMNYIENYYSRNSYEKRLVAWCTERGSHLRVPAIVQAGAFRCIMS